MTRRLSLLLIPLVLIACQTAAPSPEPPAAPPASEDESEGLDTPIGVSRIAASSLNLRSGPSTSDAVVTTLRRNARVDVMGTRGEWTRVRASSGQLGWVASRYLRADANCLPDREQEIVDAPMMTFSDSGAHGTVVVEATVDAKGSVIATRVVQNETGDPALAVLAESEIRKARFRAPVRRCVEKSFIYTYRRTY